MGFRTLPVFSVELICSGVGVTPMNEYYSRFLLLKFSRNQSLKRCVRGCRLAKQRTISQEHIQTPVNPFFRNPVP